MLKVIYQDPKYWLKGRKNFFFEKFKKKLIFSSFRRKKILKNLFFSKKNFSKNFQIFQKNCKIYEKISKILFMYAKSMIIDGKKLKFWKIHFLKNFTFSSSVSIKRILNFYQRHTNYWYFWTPGIDRDQINVILPQ